MGVILGLVVSTGCSPGRAPLPSDPGSTAGSPAATASAAAPASSDPALAEAVENHLTQGSVSLDNVRAVLVSVDGTPRLTHYRNGFSATDHEHVYSVTKSVMSTLIGQAIGDGLISGLDAPLGDLLPDYREVMTREVAAVTLRQVLTMSGGFVGDPPEDVVARLSDPEFDLIEWSLTEGHPNPAGTFEYSNVSAQVASAVLAAAVARSPERDRRTILEYARARLFEPLGIVTEPAYTDAGLPPNPEFDAAGFGWARIGPTPIGGFGLRLTAADLLSIGQLYLADGMWQGERVLPAGWVAQVLTPSDAAADYGLMWWLTEQAGRPNYSARGSEGQRIVVVPDRRVVIAIVSRTGSDTPLNDEELDPLVNDVLLTRL